MKRKKLEGESEQTSFDPKMTIFEWEYEQILFFTENENFGWEIEQMLFVTENARQFSENTFILLK